MDIILGIGSPNNKIRSSTGQLFLDISSQTQYRQTSSPEGAAWVVDETFKLLTLPTVFPDVFGTQTENYIFAAPNGTDGAPSFRSLVPNDIPNLNWSKITSGKPTTLVGYGIADGLVKTNNLSDLSSTSVARTNLGLGTLAILNTVTFSNNSDVNISTPTNGQALTYDSGTDKWINSSPSSSLTLTGDVTGSGSGSIATTIGSGKVTNTMLAGSIAASKLVGTDIATIGTISSGVWQGTAIGDSYIASASTWNAKVGTSRQVIAGTGLTGGGDFSADRTLTVTYGTNSTSACVGNDSRLSDARSGKMPLYSVTAVAGANDTNANQLIAIDLKSILTNPGDRIHFMAKLRQNGSGSKTWKTYVNTAANTTGATSLTNGGSATATDIWFDVWITYTAANTQEIVSTSGGGAPNISTGTSITRSVVTYTNSNSWYFMIYCQKGTAGDLMSLDNYFFEYKFV